MQMPSMLEGESLKRLLQGAAAGAVATIFVGFYWGGWSLGEDRQMWFYIQMWLPVWTVALTAAICFSVASFIMGRSVPGLLYWPPQLAAFIVAVGVNPS